MSKDMNMLMERWRRCVAENDDIEREYVQSRLIAGDDEDDEDDDVEEVDEWNAADDADYPSRKKKKRMKAIGSPAKHGNTMIAGHDEMMSLARGIAEDIVNTDNIEVDIATLTSIIRQELATAFQRIQKQSNHCSFQDIVNATRAWSMAQKAKPPK